MAFGYSNSLRPHPGMNMNKPTPPSDVKGMKPKNFQAAYETGETSQSLWIVNK
jgi:hypothetical protein